MGETIYVNRKDLTSEEVLQELAAGNRVIIQVDVLGKSLNMALRQQSGTYYCDTPMKLLTYETEAEMQTCLERYHLAEPSPSDESTDDPPAVEE